METTLQDKIVHDTKQEEPMQCIFYSIAMCRQVIQFVQDALKIITTHAYKTKKSMQKKIVQQLYHSII